MVLTDTGSRAVSQKFVIQFRPSSRSSNYSIVAIYKTAEEANKTFKAIKRLLKEIEADKSNKYDVDWSEEDVEVWVEGNKVQFNVDTSGYTDPIENVMRTMTPESISLFEDMQTLDISVTLPVGATGGVVALLTDPEDAKAIDFLNYRCGPANKTVAGNNVTMMWHYSGDGIYNNAEGKLYLGDAVIGLKEKPHWKLAEV